MGAADGKPFDARALARLLKPFNIRPRSIRIDDLSTPKGYHSDRIQDAWARYLPVPRKPQQPQRPPQRSKIEPFLVNMAATNRRKSWNRQSKSLIGLARWRTYRPLRLSQVRGKWRCCPLILE